MEPFHLEDWQRPLFVSLPLRSYFFFVIYGTLDEIFPAILSAPYRTCGVPDGLKISHHALKDQPEFRDKFQSGPAWEQFQRDDPQAAAAISNSPTCCALRGELSDAEHLNALRDCIGLIMFVLDHGGSGVFDVLTSNWYSLLGWRLKIFDEGPDASKRLVSFYSVEQLDGRLHLYTRGLRRFARPDLSMKNVERIDESSRIAMLEHLAEGLIAGGTIPDRQQLSFPELDASVTCRWQGSLDDPFLYNFWIELTPT